MSDTPNGLDSLREQVARRHVRLDTVDRRTRCSHDDTKLGEFSQRITTLELQIGQL